MIEIHIGNGFIKANGHALRDSERGIEACAGVSALLSAACIQASNVYGEHDTSYIIDGVSSIDYEPDDEHMFTGIIETLVNIKDQYSDYVEIVDTRNHTKVNWSVHRE